MRLQTTSGAAATAVLLRKETDIAIKQVQDDVKASKASVVAMLAKMVTSAAPASV